MNYLQIPAIITEISLILGFTILGISIGISITKKIHTQLWLLTAMIIILYILIIFNIIKLLI